MSKTNFPQDERTMMLILKNEAFDDHCAEHDKRNCPRCVGVMEARRRLGLFLLLSDVGGTSPIEKIIHKNDMSCLIESDLNHAFDSVGGIGHQAGWRLRFAMRVFDAQVAQEVLDMGVWDDGKNDTVHYSCCIGF